MIPQWLKDLTGFVKELPVAARSLTTLAMVSLGAAVAWQGAVDSNSGAIARWAPSAALVFITLVFLLLAGYYSVAEKVGQVARQVGQIERRLVVHVRMGH